MAKLYRPSRTFEVTNFYDIPIATTAPTNNQTLTYNNTTEYFEPADITTGVDPIGGGKIFSDGIRIGENGTLMNRVTFARNTTNAGNINAGAFVYQDFLPALAAGDRVYATARSTNGGLVVTRVRHVVGPDTFDSLRIENVKSAAANFIETEIIVVNV